MFFLHIPKTAGTSLRDLLARRAGPQGTLFLEAHRDQSIVELFRHAERYTLICGHVPLDSVNLLPRRPFLFTMLRDPVDRALSAFHYMQQESARLVQRANEGSIYRQLADDCAKACQMSLVEFIRREPTIAARHLGNLQVDFLTNPDIERRRQHLSEYSPQVSQKELDLAKQRLSSFDAFGLLERMQDALDYLAYALHLGVFDEMPTCNRTRSRPAAQSLDGETLAELRRMTAYDQELYDFAADLFEVRRRQMMEALLSDRTVRTSAATSTPIRRPTVLRSGEVLPGGGWYASEKVGERWLTWSGPGLESWVELGSPEGSDVELRVAISYTLRADDLHKLELSVNGSQLRTKVMSDSEGHTISAHVPAHVLRGQDTSNRVVLRVPQTYRPSDLDPANNDSRQLGVAVSMVALVPLSSP